MWYRLGSFWLQLASRSSLFHGSIPKDGEPDLLAHGLLKGSFIPPSEQRELRELTRCLVEERARTVNRLQKTLEDTNLKLADVATDILGKSGRAMLEA